jgi:phosphatidylinositol alpha-mannosyltransferase
VVAARQSTLTPRRVASVVLTAAVIVGAVIALTHLDLSVLLTAAPGWVAAALALNSLAMVFRAMAWLLMLRTALPGAHISVWRVLRATMIGVMGSALAPGRAGEPARVWLVTRGIEVEGRVATVVGTLVSQTLLNLVALATLAITVALDTGLPRWKLSGLEVLAVPVAICVIVLVGARVARSGRVARQLAALRTGLGVFRPLRRGLAIAGLQLGAWALQCLAVYTLLLALHLHVRAPLVTAAALLLAVNVTAAVPITPSNIGVFQGACLAVLATRGVGTGDGLAYGVLLQATEVVTALALGIPALLAEGGGRQRRMPVWPIE